MYNSTHVHNTFLNPVNAVKDQNKHIIQSITHC